MTQDPTSSPSRLSDDVLAKIISEARTTIRDIPRSSAEVANRLSRFNELYEALPTKPEAAALIYRDAVTGSAIWSVIGKRLLVGRSWKRSAKMLGSMLSIQDQEMSRQHFEIVLTNDGLYLLNDLNSLNGTYIDGVRQETAVLIGGSEIRAGNTHFIFTGV
jgi:FHA domain-containing protein